MKRVRERTVTNRMMAAESGMETSATAARSGEMDNIKMTVELINPIAMEEGLRVAIREGGRTVGAGVVAKILK